jgi:hypothetical protein
MENSTLKEQGIIIQILDSIKQITEKAQGYKVDCSVTSGSYKPNVLRKEKNDVINISIKLEKEEAV